MSVLQLIRAYSSGSAAGLAFRARVSSPYRSLADRLTLGPLRWR